MGTKDEAKEGQIDWRKRNEVSAGERTYVYRKSHEIRPSLDRADGIHYKDYMQSIMNSKLATSC